MTAYPKSQLQLMRQQADFFLRQLCSAQRALHFQLSQSPQTGAVITQIIHIRAFAKHSTVFLCNAQEITEQHFFADIAAVRRIFGKPRHLQLIKIKVKMTDSLLPTELLCLRYITLRHNTGTCRHSKCLISQRQMRRLQQKRRINAAAERNQHTAQAPQLLLQHGKLGFRCISKSLFIGIIVLPHKN